VVDDDAGVRIALVYALESAGRQAWPFSSGSELLAALDDLDPGCVLLDICMPGMSGLQVMEQLNGRGCDWPVIAMTGHGDVPTAVTAMKLGAIEFVEKPLRQHLIDEAIVRATAVLTAGQLRRREREEAAAALARLTPKEDAVLRELITGQQNKGVAYRLGMSVRTVEMHRANLLAKLCVRTLQESAILLARANGEAACFAA
jgi:two-component system response regulator FixJ